MTTSAGRWAAATASVRGASHERDGKPNQDAVRVVQVPGPTPGLVAAVCDGHGGDRYVRSDVGSRLGVEVACAVGQRALVDLGPSAAASIVEAHLTGTVAQSIVAEWRKRVFDDVQRRAFTADERSRAGVPLEVDPFISYGATMLLAIVAPSWVGLLQIGDGDVTIVRQARAESPVPGDDRLIGGETTSLCLTNAAADARVAVLVEPLPEAIILTSDGYANSFASPTWRSDAGIDLRDHVRKLGLDGVEERLPAWLADSATAGGDDVTMALIHRTDVVAPAAVAAITPSLSQARSTSPGASRQQNRWLLPIALAVAAAIGGGGIGWALGRTGNSTAEAGTTTATVSTSPNTSTSASISTPSTSTPTTSTSATPPPTTSHLPTTTTSAPPPVVPALTAGVQPRLFLGANDGLLLTFDPSSPNPLEPHFFGWVKIDTGPPVLSKSWQFANGELSWKGKCVQSALVLLQEGDYLRAVGADGQNLTSYNFRSGAELGSVPIVNGIDSGAITTDAGTACGSVTQATATGAGGPAATTQGG